MPNIILPIVNIIPNNSHRDGYRRFYCSDGDNIEETSR